MTRSRKLRARKPGPPRFVDAYGPWSWFLATAGYSAITMPWRTIYVLEEMRESEQLRFHELIHIEQIERDGAVRFSVLYLWFLIRYGYRNNPYEIEAYERTARRFKGDGGLKTEVSNGEQARSSGHR